MSLHLIGQAVRARCTILQSFIAQGQRNAQRCFRTSPPLLRGPHITGEERLRRIDSIPEQFSLIYRCKTDKTMHFAKTMAAITGIGIAGFWVYYYCNGHLEDPNASGILLLPTNINELKWLSGLAFFFNVAVYRLTHIYLLRIYRHGKDYIAITPGIIPRTNSKIAFSAGQLTHSGENASPIDKYTHKIAKRRVILLPPRFRTPAEYHEALVNSREYMLHNPAKK